MWLSMTDSLLLKYKFLAQVLQNRPETSSLVSVQLFQKKFKKLQINPDISSALAADLTTTSFRELIYTLLKLNNQKLLSQLCHNFPECFTQTQSIDSYLVYMLRTKQTASFCQLHNLVSTYTEISSSFELMVALMLRQDTAQITHVINRRWPKELQNLCETNIEILVNCLLASNPLNLEYLAKALPYAFKAEIFKMLLEFVKTSESTKTVNTSIREALQHLSLIQQIMSAETYATLRQHFSRKKLFQAALLIPEVLHSELREASELTVPQIDAILKMPRTCTSASTLKL